MNRHYTMKELPNSEKPYEKCLEYGAAALSDAELLAVILRSGSKNINATQLAQSILCQEQKSLLNLYYMQISDFQKIPGIGTVKAIQLKCIAEIAMRLSRTSYKDKICMTEPSTVATYFMEQLRHDTKEKLLLVMFNAKNHYLGDEVISVGTVNASLVSPREIFLKALSLQAVNIIMIHNHPSGDPTPSNEDKRATIRVLECGQMIGIYLADHIIIGDNKYISFREKGLL
ncbi:DNA repair protein RadC [Lachnospiraceae bacterium ZAX-1]